MSLFQWFTKKTPVAPAVQPESSELGQVDATVPSNGAVPNVASLVQTKTERIERRELLYSVVRECMIRAGVLSSTFKFKVLSLDSRGRKYLIMMDLAKLHADEVGRLAEIEVQIAKTAKSRHDILVTSVYWRINDQVSPGVARVTTPSVESETPRSTPASNSKPEFEATTIQPRFDPLRPDEVAAFKEALASIPSPKKLVAPGEILRSGRRNPSPYPAFEDTQLDERANPLSGTQYGDLN